MYVCKDSAAPAHVRACTRTQGPAAPRQSSGGVSQDTTSHGVSAQAGIPHRPP